MLALKFVKWISEIHQGGLSAIPCRIFLFVTNSVVTITQSKVPSWGTPGQIFNDFKQ